MYRNWKDAFSIVKFRKPTNGAVNTAEFDFPDTITSSQSWICEAPVGDWFYAPGFTYDSGSMIHFTIGNDGNLYAFTLAVPEAGSQVTIHSLKQGQEVVKDVSLLGSDSKLKWNQTTEGLVIDCPEKLDCAISSVFKIVTE